MIHNPSNVIVVSKSADEIVNNSNTMQDDNHLFYPIVANAKYICILIIYAISTVTADIRFGWGNIVGCLAVMTSQREPSCNFPINNQATHTTQGFAEEFLLAGIIHNGANPGTLQFRWAQNVAEVSDTTIYEGSSMILIPIE